ncbi:DUF5063 domain-containing protein [Georgenia sp. H159]|uniref:DUF5063 domain-containing protein n=1 Tax=Georgenia sp. H159 TaxID=3076115 RepID=UPI002D76AC68|nr:DUF5063 domain-containing protein [Georgenia sp. H159]
MPDTDESAVAQEVADLHSLAGAMAAESERFLECLTQVASGAHPDVSISLLLLAVADLTAAGARLGAVVDVLPPERFEPDDGEEPDADPLRLGLVNALDGLDEYREVPDPLVDNVSVTGSLSADLAEVALALRRGLQHHRAGNVIEALWWWQFSYLSNWGDRAAAALRALLSVLAHVRLDVPADVAADAQFDALHAEAD